MISCSSGVYKNYAEQGNFDRLLMPKDSLTLYFPLIKWRKDTTNNSLDTFKNYWYSKMLFGLKEPVISGYQGVKEIVRFTWLRTFHHPVSVRVEKQNNVIRLFAKASNGAGGFEPGNICFDSTINMSINEWKILDHQLKNTNFWQLSTQSNSDEGKDGSEWIIEAVKENKYHLVTRWYAGDEQNDYYKVIGKYLLQLSKMKEEPALLY